MKHTPAETHKINKDTDDRMAATDALRDSLPELPDGAVVHDVIVSRETFTALFGPSAFAEDGTPHRFFAFEGIPVVCSDDTLPAPFTWEVTLPPAPIEYVEVEE